VQTHLKRAGAKSNADFSNALFYFSKLFDFAIQDIQEAVNIAVNMVDPSISPSAGSNTDTVRAESNVGSAEGK
jgi:hypothetical protein